MPKIVIATRKSPLALAQTVMVEAHLQARLGVTTEQLRLVTTGDRQTEWSLEKQGGKGLFTKELEQALLRGEADVAVHSSKDLPGDMPAGLALAGFLPREDPRDVLVIREGIAEPKRIATSSPRRRLQLAVQFPDAEFCEIRGNVDTRLRKIAEGGVADATVLAAAGLRRLNIGSWPGLSFLPLGFEFMIPAVGQAAIAIQCRAADKDRFAGIFDAATARSVLVERAFQAALGGGCQTALGVHAAADTLYFFHEEIGLRSLPLGDDDYAQPEVFARATLTRMGFQL